MCNFLVERQFFVKLPQTIEDYWLGEDIHEKIPLSNIIQKVQSIQKVQMKKKTAYEPQSVS